MTALAWFTVTAAAGLLAVGCGLILYFTRSDGEWGGQMGDVDVDAWLGRVRGETGLRDPRPPAHARPRQCRGTRVTAVWLLAGARAWADAQIASLRLLVGRPEPVAAVMVRRDTEDWGALLAAVPPCSEDSACREVHHEPQADSGYSDEVARILSDSYVADTLRAIESRTLLAIEA